MIVRDRSRVTGCAGTLRLTVGTPSENDGLLESIRRYDDGLVSEASPAVSGEVTGRQAEIRRETSETRITVRVDLDGHSDSSISTGLGFFDHMLWQIPHHSGISLCVDAQGDLEVDEHHTMEDVAIALGEAILKALGDRRGIGRYGFALPMDECDALVLLDLGGRIDFKWEVPFTREYVGDTPTEMFRHFFKSLCEALKCNLHIKAGGENNHHLAEAVFKAFARTL
ncbi:MAG: bifunctional histidinol-phosphatase/imidazoleglycerol-phosphate dehydratase, partial [Bacteroidales bacterium]|nr:bifunctional histidinol-phosphatase/imidazoleglycerol-phosphate dehydratase [Bacteroidales bacterium]